MGTSEQHPFTKLQLEFLDLWKIAADFDCLYLLDFYCMDLFDHDRVAALTEEQQAELARAARPDIFAEAINQGYRPPAGSLFGGGAYDRLC